jgi:hypothetical protein
MRKKNFCHAPRREQKSSVMVHQQPQRDFQSIGYGNFSCSRGVENDTRMETNDLNEDAT